MCYKIRCDGESWKIFGFQGELNKTVAEKDAVDTTIGDRVDDTTWRGGECFCTMKELCYERSVKEEHIEVRPARLIVENRERAVVT